MAKKTAHSAKPGPASRRSPALALVMLGAAAVSLLVAVNPYGGLSQPTDLPLLCLGVVGVCAAFLLPESDSFAVLARWRVAWALGALGAWAVVSSLASGRLAGATFGTNGSALGWPVAVLGVVIVLACAFHARLLREWLTWLAVGTLLVQFGIMIPELLTRTVPAGTLSNSSNAGLVIVLLAPLVFFSGVQATTLWSRVWRLAVAASALATLWIGGARVSTIFLVLALVVWLVLQAGRRYGRKVGLALWAALGVVGLAGVAAIASRPSTLSRGAIGGFVHSRGALWEPAVRAIGARPIAGWGPDGYQVTLARFGDRGAFVAWGYWPPSIDAHNILLWIGVSLGLVGLGLAGWIGFEVGRSWLKQSRLDARGVPVGPVATGVLLYALSAMATPTALQTLPIAFIVLGASLLPEATDAPPPARAWSLSLRWCAVVLAVLVGAYGLTRLTVANRVSAETPAAAQRAADLWRIDPYLYYNASLIWGYAAQNSPSVLQAQPDLIAIRKAVALEPSNPFYQLEFARTLASYGASPADIEAAYKRAIDLAPASPEAKAAYAEFLIANSRTGEAKPLLDAAQRLAPSTEMARVFAVYYRAIGDEKEALRYDELRQQIAQTLLPPNMVLK